MTTFFISDLHLGHKNIIHFKNKKGIISRQMVLPNGLLRPFESIEEHDDYIIEKINSVVSKEDKTYFVGDIAFGQESLKLIGKIKGYKYLIGGNHDCYATDSYLKYFNKIFGAKMLDKCILSHIPVHPCQLENRYKVNIHGHMHSYNVKKFNWGKLKFENDPRYINVSCEQLDFLPISYDEIKEKIKNI